MKECFVLKNYCLYYGEKEVLHDISMPIYRNEVTAFIGPSGCGKSSLLRSFNRMNDLIEEAHSKGTLLYDGEPVASYDPLCLRRQIGMVFQSPNPFPMSVFDNVAYGPRCQGRQNKAELAKLVEKSLRKAWLYEEVKDRMDKSALSLSGGQQQRLCIARALAMNPSVLLMDEPTSALDPIATVAIEGLIVSLRKDYTIVIVTHNMQQATRISDYTAFFYLGNLEEYATTDRLFKEPANPKTENYIAGRFG
jgi:phosphate transport system ATP-binding protein